MTSTRIGRFLQAIVAHPYLAVGLVALAARVAFAVVSFVVNRYLIPDEQQYVELAFTVSDGAPAEAWFPFFGQQLYSSTWPFTGVVRFLFDVFWPSRIFAQLYVAVVGSVVAVLTVVLARRFVSRRFALLAGLIVALVPSQVLWSAVALREAVVWLTLVLMAILVAAAIDAGPRRLLLIALALAVTMVALSHLRNQTLVAAAWALPVAGLFGGRGRLPRFAVMTGLSIVVPILLGLGPMCVDYVRNNVPSLGVRRAYLALDARSGVTDITLVKPAPAGADSAGDQRSVLAGGRTPRRTGRPGREGAKTTSTMARPRPRPVPTTTVAPGGEVLFQGYRGEIYAVEESYGASVRHLPRGLKAFLLRPFPWESAANAAVAVARVENLGWYLLYGLAGAGVLLRRRSAHVVFPVVVTGLIVGIAGVTQGNVGTGFRHRAQLLWVLAALAVVPLEHLYERRRGAVARCDLEGQA